MCDDDTIIATSIVALWQWGFLRRGLCRTTLVLWQWKDGEASLDEHFTGQPSTQHKQNAWWHPKTWASKTPGLRYTQHQFCIPVGLIDISFVCTDSWTCKTPDSVPHWLLATFYPNYVVCNYVGTVKERTVKWTSMYSSGPCSSFTWASFWMGPLRFKSNSRPICLAWSSLVESGGLIHKGHWRVIPNQPCASAGRGEGHSTHYG